MDHSTDNKRIAKNTLMLYIRMLLIIGVTFFTFRILLQELGDAGYGTYNAVAGVIVLFSFLSSAMTTSTQRFFSYYLGRKEHEKLSDVYSMSINVHALICLVLLILAETIGLWFLNKYMRFPSQLYGEVNLLYQFTILSFLLQIMMVPYKAMIISHERMSFYAYFSIVESLLKLGAVLFLKLFHNNRLVIYGGALFVVTLLLGGIYHAYCKRSFNACQYRWSPDKVLFKEMTSFSGWNMLGGIGNVGASQGINMLFNIFCGVLVNAAMGISNQISAGISGFVGNFQTAFNPQLIKSYAAGDYGYFNSLIFRCSRLSFLLIFIIGFPIIVCTPLVLRIWLGTYPEIAVPFTQLTLIFCMIDALSGPLWTAAQASGRIKTYMIIISLMIFSNVPAALLLLWLGLSPVSVLIYKVAMNLTIHIVRTIYLKYHISFPAMDYYKKVMVRVGLFILMAAPVPVIYYHSHSGIIHDILTVVISVLC